MLALTKKTDYALIALSHLAKRPETVVSAREIAEACGVPQPILTNILKTLASAGIMVSTRGAAADFSRGGKSELRRAGSWVTPRKGDLTDSATETYRPGVNRGKGEMAR
jgi:DNA-binding transcriptional ArsR family regulator